MKKIILCLFMALSSVASADSVEINGTTVTCTNTCDITFIPPSTFEIKDCCGGSVTVQIK